MSFSYLYCLLCMHMQKLLSNPARSLFLWLFRWRSLAQVSPLLQFEGGLYKQRKQRLLNTRRSSFCLMWNRFLTYEPSIFYHCLPNLSFKRKIAQKPYKKLMTHLLFIPWKEVNHNFWKHFDNLTLCFFKWRRF